MELINTGQDVVLTLSRADAEQLQRLLLNGVTSKAYREHRVAPKLVKILDRWDLGEGYDAPITDATVAANS